MRGHFSAFDLVDGPLRVFGDERVGVSRGFLKRRQVIAAAGIAEGDADIAEEGRTLDALDGGLGEERAEGVIGEAQEVAQSHRKDRIAGVE